MTFLGRKVNLVVVPFVAKVLSLPLPLSADKLWPKPLVAEPIFYLTVLFAPIIILINDFSEAGGFYADIGFRSSVSYAWIALMIFSPVQVMLAHWLINYTTGISRLMGMWHRLGGDFGIVIGLICYLFARLRYWEYDPHDAALFNHIIILGVTLFGVALIARDILVLYIVERLSNEIEEIKDTKDLE